MGKTIRRAALDTYMSQGLEVTVEFKNGDKITGFLVDVSEETFRFRGGVDLSYDNLGSVQVVGKRGEEEPETKERSIRNHEQLLREATSDELGKENEELRERVTELEAATDPSGVWISAGAVMRHHQHEVDNKALRAEVAALQERLTVAEADGKTNVGCSKSECVNYNRCVFVLPQHPGFDCQDYKTGWRFSEETTEATPDEPVDTTAVGEAPESLRQKLEHATRHGYEVTVSCEDYRITDKIVRIGRYEAHGDRECVDFLGGSCVYLDTVQHVETAYTQPESKPGEPEDAHIEASAVYNKLNDAMEARREVTVDFDTNYTKGTLTGNVKYIDHEKATIGEIDVYFVDMTRLDDANIHHLGCEPEDIAKQRWMVSKGFEGLEIRQICDGHEPSLAVVSDGADDPASDGATDAQAELMAAAPELADRLREAVESGTAFEEDMPEIAGNIKFLRELGVSNVATWYTGEDGQKDEPVGIQVEAAAELLNENADLKKQIAAHDGAISVAGARKIMREAFENDPEFKMTYIANIAVMLYEWFPVIRHGLMRSSRNEAAEKILDRVFEK